PLHDIRLLLIGLFEPSKCLVVVAKAHIRLNERSRRDILLPPTSLQLVNQTQRFRTPAGMAVGSGQDTDHAGTSVTDGYSLFKWCDSILRTSFTDKRESQVPKGDSVVWPHRQSCMEFPDCFVIATCGKQNPGKIGTRNRKRIQFSGSLGPFHSLFCTSFSQ